MKKETKIMKLVAKNNDEKLLKSKQDKGKQTDPPVPRRYRIRLKTTEDVRRLLSVTLNLLRRGEIDVPVGRALIYGGQVLLQVFEQGSFAAKLADLENKMREAGLDQ